MIWREQNMQSNLMKFPEDTVIPFLVEILPSIAAVVQHPTLDDLVIVYKIYTYGRRLSQEIKLKFFWEWGGGLERWGSVPSWGFYVYIIKVKHELSLKVKPVRQLSENSVESAGGVFVFFLLFFILVTHSTGREIIDAVEEYRHMRLESHMSEWAKPRHSSFIILHILKCSPA